MAGSRTADEVAPAAGRDSGPAPLTAGVPVARSDGLLTKIIHYAPGSLAVAVVGVLSSVLFTRLFGAGEYGRYSLVTSIAGVVAAVAAQWLQQGASRYVPGEQDAGRLAVLKTAIGRSLVVTGAGLAVLAGVAVALLRPVLDARWHGMLWPACAFAATAALVMPVQSVLQSEGRARRYSAYNVAMVVGRFAVSLLIVLAVRDVSGLVLGTAVVQGLILVPMWRDAGIRVSRVGLPPDASVSSAVKRIAAYGTPMIGYFVANNLLAVGDRYVIQYFRGEAEVGIYAANYTLMSFGVSLLTAPVLLAAHPFLMKAWAVGDAGETARWLGRIVEAFLALGALFVGATYVFSADLAALALGPQFREGHTIMPVVLAGVVAWQAAMYTHKPLEFRNRTLAIFWLVAGAGVVNTVANVVLVPRYGYPAAAYTTLGAYVLYAAVTAAAGRSVVRWSLDRARVAELLVISAAGFGAAAWLRAALTARAGWGWGFGVAVGAAALTSALLVWRTLLPIFSGAARGERVT